MPKPPPTSGEITCNLASGTFNISTAAALVVAACGVPVAKHGNRAISSRSGSADLLTAAGVNLEAPLEVVMEGMHRLNFGFLMAPRHHLATRNVAPVRTELGTRTIFNLLGPLSSPALAKRQVLGVFDKRWVEPVAQVLHRLGSTRAWVVHGSDGLDEITTTGITHVAELKNRRVRAFTVRPNRPASNGRNCPIWREERPARTRAASAACCGAKPAPFVISCC